MTTGSPMRSDHLLRLVHRVGHARRRHLEADALHGLP